MAFEQNPDGVGYRIGTRKTAWNPWKLATIVLAFTLGTTLLLGWMNWIPQERSGSPTAKTHPVMATRTVIPEQVALPIDWRNTGRELVESGVIDAGKLEALYASRGGTPPAVVAMLDGSVSEVVMTEDTAKDLLNLFWAFGFANENAILTDGPMTDARYGGDPSRFASTGGWTLRSGSVMEHYGAHPFVVLSDTQQARVERVANGIYRPCCNNSTYFPDCNHGMAMLGLLELMADNGASEAEMYKVALGVNTLWFPDTYEAIFAFLGQNGVLYDAVAPNEILGVQFSSAAGIKNIRSALEAPVGGGGRGGCSF